MAGWADLPPELRFIIWNHAASDYHTEPPKFGSLSTVCRDWQRYFETRNFQSLTLRQDDVEDFGRIIQAKRLSHLRHLRLHISLPEYDCEQSMTQERQESAIINEIIFTNALCSLLDNIATVETGLNAAEEIGLTLELSVSSESDGKHAFRSFRLSEEYDKLARRYPHRPDKPFLKHEFSPNVRSLVRGCTSHHLVDALAFNRVHGCRPLGLRLKPTGLQTPKPPRVVNMVTGLLTRRQFYRSISMSALSFLVRNCFPRIVNLRIEMWQAPRVNYSQAEENLKELLHFSVSRELQSLDIFEDRSTDYVWHDQYAPTDDAAVSVALWRACHTFPKLQSFSVCSVIDASVFFSNFSDSFAEINPWPELRTLCLTAEDLMPPISSPLFQVENEQSAWKLLTNATKVANLMPKLEVLELWHAERNVACIWTYYKAQDHARLIVRDGDTYTELHDQPDAVQRLGKMAETWADYATELLDRTVTCELLVLPLSNSKYNDMGWDVEKSYSPRDIVQHLELAGVILHPTTLHQMKWESHHEPHTGEPLVPEPALPKEEEPGEAPGAGTAHSSDPITGAGEGEWYDPPLPGGNGANGASLGADPVLNEW